MVARLQQNSPRRLLQLIPQKEANMHKSMVKLQTEVKLSKHK